MIPTKNSFIKGLNQDTSPAKFSNLNYFYLINGKVITETGLTTGAVENEKGNALAFKFPTTSPVYTLVIPSGYTGPDAITIDGTTVNLTSTTRDELLEELTTGYATEIAAGNFTITEYGSDIIIVGLDAATVATVSGTLTLTQIVSSDSNLKICGMGKMDNYIIVISTSETGQTPSNSAGQLWLLEYDEATDSIVGLNANDELVPSVHLKYNNILNLSLYYRCGEIIGRYENSVTGRIYWTDFYNSLRTANLLEQGGIFSVKPVLLDVVAAVSMSEPIITGVSTGSIPTPAVVQYGYVLASTTGARTIFSPVSNLVQLTAFDPTSEAYEDYIGATSTGGSSVTYKIDNIDTNFEIIEHIAIIYQTRNIPVIVKFKEENVPASGSLTVIHNGDENYVDISSQEFNALTNTFNKCKSIASKRNKLLVANTKNSTFDLDYDARAYRFNAGGLCEILDSTGSSTSFNAPNYPSSETLDAINPFALAEDHADYDSSFKYQSDGTTLGGEGVNIRYEFISENYLAQTDNLAVTQPFLQTNRYPSPTIMNVGNNETYDAFNYFKDYKSPLKSAYLRGYMRGEVYRFGIVFYDLKGNPSFTKWIGDIRFPEAFDSGFEPVSASGVNVYCKTLGIRFYVDISDIKDQISGFSITRVEREESDKTRLGTCLHVALTDGTSSALDRYTDFNGAVGADTTIQVGGSSTTSAATINTAKTYQYNDAQFEPSVANLAFLVSPLVQFASSITGFTYKSGDYLKEIGYSSHDNSRYSSSGDTVADLDFCKGWANPINYRNFEIEDQLMMAFGEYTDNSIGSGNRIFNTTQAKDSGLDSEVPFGIGNKKLLIKLSGTSSGIIDAHSGNEFDYAPFYVTTAGSTFYYKHYAYCRILGSQYNGNTYESRANQAYMALNFVRVDSTSDDLQTIDPWNGDTYTSLYSDEIVSQYWGTASAIGTSDYEDSVSYKLGLAVIFPTEVCFNTKLRQGTFWEKDRDTSNMGAFVQNFYEYDNVYSQEPNAKRQFFTKDFIDNTVEEHPHRIWASDSKLDGEFADSWRIFRPNNFREVDGIHGPINKLITHRDKIFFYQDRAFGIVSVEDRSIVNDETGAQIVLGNGGVLDFHAYISTRTGAFHQFGVVESGSSLYHVDALNRKIFRYTEGMGAKPLTDVNGLSAYMADEISGDIVNTDKTLANLTSDSAVGIHGEFDARHNRVFFTFLKGDYETRGGDTVWAPTGFTVSFNESMDSFESFYSFVPTMYLNSGRRLLSVNPDAKNEAYLHNVGTRGEYYGVLRNMKITLLVNAQTDLTKVLDVIEYLMEMKDSAGVDIPDETFTTVRFYTNYQDSGTITLTPRVNIKPRFRKWRMNIIRDSVNNKPRLVDYYFMIDLIFNNNADKQLVLHDLTSYVRKV